MGAGLSRRRTAANTGEAGAMHRSACFAGKPAPTGFLTSLSAVRETAKPVRATCSRPRVPCSPHPPPCPG
ncbi:hypothetical protein AL532_08055 [Pseudomonas monteilii]|nr:hypothetical protein AL532_08055 [Pseudomonas monteilii]